MYIFFEQFYYNLIKFRHKSLYMYSLSQHPHHPLFQILALLLLAFNIFVLLRFPTSRAKQMNSLSWKSRLQKVKSLPLAWCERRLNWGVLRMRQKTLRSRITSCVARLRSLTDQRSFITKAYILQSFIGNGDVSL